MSQQHRHNRWNRRTAIIPSAALALSIITIIPVCTPLHINKTPTLELPAIKPNIPTSITNTAPRAPPRYFVFLVDASKKAVHFQEEIWALSNITEYWKLNGSGEVYVTAADTGLKDEYLDNLDGFYTKREDWDRIRARLSSKTIFNRADLPMSPIDISKLISSVYCNKSSAYHIGENGNAKFIIFTSYSDAAGLDAALQASKPWLSCPMTKQESIFMVSIDGGSTHLKQLSYPTSDLFMQMTDFSQNEIQHLTKEIIWKLCDCQRLSDGSLPAGCVLPSSRSTTPVPITTPKSPISSANLSQLSYPSSDLFMQMNNFSKNEIQQLTEKINSDMYEPKPTTTPSRRGYFAFLVDASNKVKDFQQEIWAIRNITEHWNLDGSGEVFVTAIDTGLNDEYLDSLDVFVTKRENWNRIQAHLSSNTIFNTAESPMSPPDISKLISSVYCNKNSKSHIEENGKIKFIIFTSYSDATGIDAALKASKPWLSCPMAGQESIFMVSIDGAATTHETVAPSSTTQKPVAPSTITQEPKAPSSTTQKPVAPPSTTQEPKAQSSTTQEPKAPSSTTQNSETRSRTTQSSQTSATSSAPSLTSSINYIQILALLILIVHY